MEKTYQILLYRAYHAQRAYMRAGLAGMGLGAGQPKLLSFLATNGPCLQKDMAEYFEIDPAAVCRMLDSLDRNGFIQRGTSRAGRKTGLIHLTESGRRAHESWQHRRQAMERTMLEGFSEEERAQLADYLSRAYRNLRTALNREADQ